MKTTKANPTETAKVLRNMGIKTVGRISVIHNRSNGRWEVLAMVRMNDGGMRNGMLADFDNVTDAVDFEVAWNG